MLLVLLIALLTQLSLVGHPEWHKKLCMVAQTSHDHTSMAENVEPFGWRTIVQCEEEVGGGNE